MSGTQFFTLQIDRLRKQLSQTLELIPLLPLRGRNAIGKRWRPSAAENQPTSFSYVDERIENEFSSTRSGRNPKVSSLAFVLTYEESNFLD
jgi:hypothetical protein